MSKKLWAVSVELEMDICVLAETEEEARDLARDSAREEMRNQCADWWVNKPREVTEEKGLPEDWNGSAPYGGDGNTTTTEFLAALKETPKETP